MKHWTLISLCFLAGEVCSQSPDVAKIQAKAKTLQVNIANFLGAGKQFSANDAAFKSNAAALIDTIDDIVPALTDVASDKAIKAGSPKTDGLVQATQKLANLLNELKGLLQSYQKPGATVGSPCVNTNMQSYLSDVGEAITAIIRENMVAASNLVLGDSQLTQFKNAAPTMEFTTQLARAATDLIQKVLSSALGVSSNDATKVDQMLSDTEDLIDIFTSYTFTASIHIAGDALDLMNKFVAVQ